MDRNKPDKITACKLFCFCWVDFHYALSLIKICSFASNQSIDQSTKQSINPGTAQHNDHSLLITSYLDTLLPGSSPPTWITEENEEVERRFIGRSHFVVDERGGDALNSSDVFTHTSCRVYHKTESSVGSLGDAQHAESGEETWRKENSLWDSFSTKRPLRSQHHMTGIPKQK